MDDFSTEIIPDPTLSGEVSPGGLETYLAELAAEKQRPMKSAVRRARRVPDKPNAY